MKSKLKKKKKKETGFTLVELLGVLAILSVVLTIVLYSVLNIVNNSKEKSYLVTINNVEEAASNYILEDMSLVPWTDEGSYQYQCVTVQNLIDVGYFKGDVLESLVDDDIKLQASDYIYLERDSSTKAITKNVLLVGDRTSYSGLCGDINNSGNIRIVVDPSGWSKEKEITVYYKLYNGNLSDYKYDYNYILSDGSVDKGIDEVFNNTTIYKKLTVNENGTLYAKIKDSSGVELVEKSLSITKIDNTDPSASISSTNNVSSSQTVTLSMSDSGSGVKSYYFGKTNPQGNDVEWTLASNDGVATSEDSNDNAGGLSSYSTTKTINESGIWYLGVKDVVGNVKIVSKDFYITNLSISNGSVSPSSVLTMSGNQFTVPTGIANANYTFYGWYNNSSYSGSVITTYKPTGNVTLYGKVEVNTYTITLNNNGATTAGTDKIYEKYGVGIYLDSANTKKMSTSGNKITVPAKTGYVFGGYYYGTSTSDYATKMIDSSGYITSDFTSTMFSSNMTLYAKWTVEEKVYTITLNNNGATTAGTDKIYEKYGVGIYLDSANTKKMSTSSNKITVPSRTGYVFGGYYYGTASGETAVQLINSSGYITSNFTNNYFSSDVTLVAKWTANRYTISYICDGEELTDYEQTVSYGSSYKIQNQLCSKSGYKFDGWYDTTGVSWSNTDGIGMSGTWSYVSGQYGITSDNKLKLTARFSVPVYTITLDSQDATTAGTEKIYLKYGDGVYLDSSTTKKMSTSSNKITIPTKTGYMFSGYYVTETLTATSEETIQLIDSSGYITSKFTNKYFSSNATIYAGWTEEEHDHVWNAVGNTIYNLGGFSLFTCGHDHSKAYPRYCSICQMSLKYYKTKVNTSVTYGSMICPCEPSFNGLAKYVFDDSGVSSITEHGGLTKGDAKLSITTSINSDCSQH